MEIILFWTLIQYNNECPVPKLRGREVVNNIKVYLNTIFKDMHSYFFWVDAITVDRLSKVWPSRGPTSITRWAILIEHPSRVGLCIDGNWIVYHWAFFWVLKHSIGNLMHSITSQIFLLYLVERPMLSQLLFE